MKTARRGAGAAVFVLAFVVLGLPDFGHGVAWAAMRGDLQRPLADLGTFLACATVGYLAVATNAGRLARRWRVEGLVGRATLASAAGLTAVAAAPGWLVAVAGAVLCGVGAGGMDTGINAAAALRGDGRVMGLLHAGYGLGAAAGPVLVGASLVAGTGWRAPYVLFAAADVLLLGVLAGRDLGPAPAQQPMGSPRGMVLPCAAFLVHVALESTIGQWAFTSLTLDRGLGELTASVWVGVYWIGLVAGRLWLGVAGHRLPVRPVLGAAVGGAVAGTLLLTFGGPVAPAGLLVAGSALSVVFPLLMLVTPDRVGHERAAAAVGWQAASASVGAAAGPVVVGLALQHVGIGAYGPATLAMATALAAVIAAVTARPARDPVAASSR